MGLIEAKSNRSTGLTEFQGEAALLENNSVTEAMKDYPEVELEIIKTDLTK